MKTFKVNGKTFEAKELGFNEVCKLEDMGINLMSMSDLTTAKIFSLVRGYLAICMNIDPERVGEVATDFDINEVMEAFNYSMESSGFFRLINARTQEEDGAIPQKKSK